MKLQKPIRTANAAKASPEAGAGSPEATTPAVPEDTSTLGLLCKGAGVDPADVRWRMASGLDVTQAVGAALAQKQNNEGGK